MIEIVSEFINRATVRTIVYVRDDDDAPADPTSVLIDITDPSGTLVVNADEIVSTGRVDTGVFEHFFNTTSSSALGEYRGIARAVDGVGGSAKTSAWPFKFTIK